MVATITRRVPSCTQTLHRARPVARAPSNGPATGLSPLNTAPQPLFQPTVTAVATALEAPPSARFSLSASLRRADAPCHPSDQSTLSPCPTTTPRRVQEHLREGPRQQRHVQRLQDHVQRRRQGRQDRRAQEQPAVGGQRREGRQEPNRVAAARGPEEIRGNEGEAHAQGRAAAGPRPALHRLGRGAVAGVRRRHLQPRGARDLGLEIEGHGL